jgi:hypothetical protein
MLMHHCSTMTHNMLGRGRRKMLYESTGALKNSLTNRQTMQTDNDFEFVRYLGNQFANNK